MGYQCPACDGDSEKCYRCTECGRDLADVNRGIGTGSTGTGGGRSD